MTAIGWTFIGIVTRKTGLPWMLAAGVTSFLLCSSYLLRWSPWEGRLFIMAVALGSPLLGLLAERVSHRVSVRLLVQLVALYAVISGLGAATGSAAKPVAAWGVRRAVMQTLTRPEMGPIVERVNRSVPMHGRLAVFLQIDDWDYPFFGPHLDRSIEPLVLSTKTRAGTMIHTDVQDVLTHQPENAVALLFRQQHIAGCRTVWTIGANDAPAPWKLFRCTASNRTGQTL